MVSESMKLDTLLGSKALTNLDCVLKGRDIILVVLVVMHRCEMWIIKKAES